METLAELTEYVLGSRHRALNEYGGTPHAITLPAAEFDAIVKDAIETTFERFYYSENAARAAEPLTHSTWTLYGVQIRRYPPIGGR